MLKKEAFPSRDFGKFKFAVRAEKGQRHNEAHVEASYAGRSGNFRVHMDTFAVTPPKPGKTSLTSEEVGDVCEILESLPIRQWIVDSHFATLVGAYKAPEDFGWK